MKYFLAIDIGASSGRHILGFIENGKLCLEEIYRFENGFEKKNGNLIWNIKHLETEIKNGIKKCGEINKIPVSVAIDTWGVDYVLLDENEKVIEPVFAYRDGRTAEIIAETEKIIPFENLYKTAGIEKENFNTVYQLYCDKMSSKLQKAKHFLMTPDFLAYTLTGKMANEYTIASTTSMVNAEKREWDFEIIKALGYPAELFLPLSQPRTVVGEFSKELQSFAGFNSKVILCPSHDTASAVAGCPLNDDSLYISSGTWSLIGTEIKNPVLTDKSRLSDFTNEGGIDKRICYLRNYMGMWLFQNIRKNLDKKYTYDEMMEMAKASGYVDYFDVNDQSLVAPDNMISAVNSLLGNKDLPLASTINCVYHSLAKSYKSAVEEIESLTGKTINSIFIVGGGSKDTYLNRLTNEYTGKKVFIGLDEATAMGNIIAQISAEEKIDLKAARALVKNSFDITGI